MSTTRTIAVTGVTEHDAARFAALMERHRSKLDVSWANGDAAGADLLLVDVESAYGQMDWLRARSRGRLVIAYTSASEPLEPEFSLRKPVVGGDLVALLNRIAADLNARPQAPAPLQPANAASYEAAPVVELVSVPVANVAAPATPAEPAAATPAVPAAPAAPPLPSAAFIDEVVTGLDASEGPMRLVCEGLSSIIIDPVRQRWHAGVGLKALSGWCKRPLGREQMVRLDAEEFASAVEILPGQPYSRLVWFAHLMRSEGNLDPALPADARYRLNRWPLVEREFPKHFRIATAMMRGTGTLEEIAALSSAGVADVADFINAYNALGYVEYAPAVPMAVVADRNGLLDRMRKSLRS
jgi:hypothetical protein